MLDRLAFVRAAQAAGLSLAEIHEVIAIRDDTGPPCEHVAALLDAHAFDLDARIAELTALREDVRRLCERAATWTRRAAPTAPSATSSRRLDPALYCRAALRHATARPRHASALDIWPSSSLPQQPQDGTDGGDGPGSDDGTAPGCCRQSRPDPGPACAATTGFGPE